MTRRRLHEQVATATGESIDTVRRIGFQLLTGSVERNDEESDWLWIECSGCKRNLLLSSTGFDDLPEFADCERCDAVFDYQFDELFSAHPDEIAHSVRQQELYAA